MMIRALITLTAILLLSSCTVVRYKSTERTLTVIDIHPGGESLSLSGILDGTGALDVNREQGSNEGIITSAVDAVTGVPGL